MSLPQRANRRILFIDMNSFFASCEQADHPELQNKPVIVTPTEGSCALSASYEAKAFGIRTGTSEKEARFLCPQVIAVRARPKVYMSYHYKIAEILRNLSPRLTMRSVDEGSLELFKNEDPWKLAREIKDQINTELSPALKCSIGIAPNVFLAKLATEIQKPNGLVEIKLESLEDAYAKLQLRDFCGINYAMERQLNRLQIFTPLDFYRTDPHYLRSHLGVVGYRWWLKMHGYSIDDYAPTSRKSLSHSHVLPPHQRTPGQAYVTLQRLVMKVGHRLRKEGYTTSHIGLSILYIDRSRYSNHLHITPCSDTLTLSDHVQHLWQDARPTNSILKLAVWTWDLSATVGKSLSLFSEERKRQSLAHAMDKINDRHGVDTIHFAITETDGSRAPDRIAFSSLFDIEFE